MRQRQYRARCSPSMGTLSKSARRAVRHQRASGAAFVPGLDVVVSCGCSD